MSSSWPKEEEDKKVKQNFVTAINCIDGRTHGPLIDFIKRKFSAKYIDLVTEPGPDNILSKNRQRETVKSIKSRVLISIEKHGSKILIVTGHHDCAGNPVADDEHFRQIKKAVKNVNKWNLGISVYGVWIDRNWKVILL